MKDYFKIIPAVHAFFIENGKILLARRINTGYEDGNYGVPAGHVESGERAQKAMVREIKEETNLDVDENELKMVQVMHRKSTTLQERVDFFFEIKKWTGELRINEKNKCDDIKWFAINELPPNIIPYLKSAIENYQRGISYSEFGWK